MSSGTTAFLGPKGTQSHIALKEFSPVTEHIALNNISEIFIAISTGKAEVGFVPLENVIEGSVNQTLDELLKYRKEIFIADSFLFKVEHALGSLSSELASELSTIYSHPQALGQCSDFIQKTAPKAALCSVNSTVAACELVKNEKLGSAGVIAHKKTLEEKGFKIISSGISNTQDNHTRFIAIKKGQADLSSEIETPIKSKFVTSVLIHPGKDRRGLLHEILELISVRFRINLNSINSRPDSSGGYVFYLELEGHPNSKAIKECLSELERYADVVTGDTVEISVFGGYQRESQELEDALQLGIIGGEGSMGSLFKKMFEELGHKVLVSDKGTKLSNKELAAKSDVIVLSLPMNALAEVSREIKSSLKPGQLIIENCSVKDSSLQTLEDTLPKDVELLGVHTLFGTSLDSFSGQNIIITKTKSSGELAERVEELFYTLGARLTHLGSEDHDAHAAVMQSLVHALVISYGEIMNKYKISRSDHDNFSTPNSRALFYALERISNLGGELVSDMQLKNPKAKEVREDFAKFFTELTKELSSENTKLLEKAFEKCKKLTKTNSS